MKTIFIGYLIIFFYLQSVYTLCSQEIISNNPVNIAFNNSVVARLESNTNIANYCLVSEKNKKTTTDNTNNDETDKIKTNFAKIFFSPSLLAIEGYKEFGLSTRYKVDKLAMALEGYSIGVLSLSELNFNFSFAYLITDNISIGGGLGLISKSIQGYGSAITTPISIYAAMNVSPELRFAAVMENLNRAEISTQSQTDKLKQRIGIGTNIMLGEDADVSFDIMQEIDFNTTASIGLNYKINNEVKLRSGASTNQSVSFGAGLVLNNFTIDIGTAYSVPLGIKYAVGLGYLFN